MDIRCVCRFSLIIIIVVNSNMNESINQCSFVYVEYEFGYGCGYQIVLKNIYIRANKHWLLGHSSVLPLIGGEGDFCRH